LLPTLVTADGYKGISNPQFEYCMSDKNLLDLEAEVFDWICEVEFQQGQGLLSFSD
jgi:hypothetical protein